MDRRKDTKSVDLVHVTQVEPSFDQFASVKQDEGTRQLETTENANVKKRFHANCWSFFGLPTQRKGKSVTNCRVDNGQPDHLACDSARCNEKTNHILHISNTAPKSWFHMKRTKSSSKTPEEPNKRKEICKLTGDQTGDQICIPPSCKVHVPSVSRSATQNSSDTLERVASETNSESFINTSGVLSVESNTYPGNNSYVYKNISVPLKHMECLLDDRRQPVDPQLLSMIEHCDRRLERLYGRLIWLRNTADVSPKFPDKCKIRSISLNEFAVQPPSPEHPRKDAVTGQRSAVTDDKHIDGTVKTIENQISYISKRLHQLRSQIEAYSYLSWLGLTEEAQTSKLVIAGRGCPAPNPQIHLIRRPDSDCHTTIAEYQELSRQSLTEKVRLALRETTFNNWPWSDAWLIRFVRQMFFDLGLVDRFKLSAARLDTWLCDVYRRYNRVPFHNYKHAFMVTQMAYTIVWSAKLKDYLMDEEQLTLLISAICHDLDHPGFNNAYQINAGTELAVRYNDRSPLENHHSAMAFDILSRKEANLLSHLDAEMFRRIRDGIIRCILATDMSRHNEILSQFNAVLLGDLATSQAIDLTTKRPGWCMDKTKLDLVMMILIKLCDISNEARPLSVSDRWINCLLAEFFNQSDYEKLVGLPVAPFMDRENVTKAASQCGFIRFVILPLYEAAARLIPELKEVIVKPVIVQLDYYTDMQKLEEKTDSNEDQSVTEPETTDHSQDTSNS